MLSQLEATFKKWSPALFMGWSNIGFDDEMIRNEFLEELDIHILQMQLPQKT